MPSADIENSSTKRKTIGFFFGTDARARRMTRTNQGALVGCSLSSGAVRTDAGDVPVVTVGGRPTKVRLVRLWEVEDPAFRNAVADVFQSVWPSRKGECVAIRRGTHDPAKKPTPLVLVSVDGSGVDTTPRVLGYTIVYPSSAMKRPEGSTKTGECANCTLNSVLVPFELRSAGIGAVLVKLAARVAVTELGFECVTAWCQPRLVKFYETCGFAYEPPKRKNKSATGTATKKDALWAKLLNLEVGDGDGYGDGDGDGDKPSSSPDSSDDELDECMRMFVENRTEDLPKA